MINFIRLFLIYFTIFAPVHSDLLSEYIDEPEKLPSHLLAFPFANHDYRNKIIKSGDQPLQIWSQKKINQWVSGQGVSISVDSSTGGY